MTIQGDDVISFSTRPLDKSLPVLVVEDQALLALDTQDILGELGFCNVEICLNYDQARSSLLRNRYGLAVFDINLGGNLTFGLISMARRRGAVVVTMSGYLPGMKRVDEAILLAKPIDSGRLMRAIEIAAAGMPLSVVI